jgi:hypothetical protein
MPPNRKDKMKVIQKRWMTPIAQPFAIFVLPMRSGGMSGICGHCGGHSPQARHREASR